MSVVGLPLLVFWVKILYLIILRVAKSGREMLVVNRTSPYYCLILNESVYCVLILYKRNILGIHH